MHPFQEQGPGYEDAPLLPPEQVIAWHRYLNSWHRDVYLPLFAPRGVSVDAALTVWFVNRLRNALPDFDAGNDPPEPWRDG